MIGIKYCNLYRLPVGWQPWQPGLLTDQPAEHTQLSWVQLSHTEARNTLSLSPNVDPRMPNVPHKRHRSAIHFNCIHHLFIYTYRIQYLII